MPKRTKQSEEEKKLVGILMEYIRINKLTQTEMANRLEVKQGTLSNWITGNNGITPTCQARIRFVCHSLIAHNDKILETEGIKNQIIAKLMASDMCAECKIKAYNLIKDIVAAPA